MDASTADRLSTKQYRQHLMHGYYLALAFPFFLLPLSTCQCIHLTPQLDSCVCNISITPEGKTCMVILLCISALTEKGVITYN